MSRPFWLESTYKLFNASMRWTRACTALQVAELAEWALAAVPAAQHAHTAKQAAPHVLALFRACFNVLACTHACVLGEVLQVPPGLAGVDHPNKRSKSRRLLMSDSLSENIVSLTLEHVLPVVLSPETGCEAPQVSLLLLPCSSQVVWSGCSIRWPVTLRSFDYGTLLQLFSPGQQAYIANRISVVCFDAPVELQQMSCSCRSMRHPCLTCCNATPPQRAPPPHIPPTLMYSWTPAIYIVRGCKMLIASISCCSKHCRGTPTCACALVRIL